MPPTLRPRYLLSAACAASSTTGRPSARIGSRSAGWPARCTGMIAFVRSVTSAGISAGSMLRSPSRTSQKTGRRAAVLDHVRRRGPRDRARDHLVSRPDAEREQRQVERGRSRRDGEHVLGLEVGGHALLQQRRPRAGRQPARAERLGDGRDLLLPDRGRLEAELWCYARVRIDQEAYGLRRTTSPGERLVAVAPVARTAPARSAPRRSGPNRQPGRR